MIHTSYSDFLNEQVDNKSRHEKYMDLKNNLPVVVYRGLSKTGINFYKGNAELPFTYYSLTFEKASEYGNVSQYVFNADSLPIKIFYGKDLFDKFGMNCNVENKHVIETLISEGYSAVLLTLTELVVYDKSLITKKI